MDLSQFPLDDATKNNINTWLTGSYDKDTQDEIRRLLKENIKEIIDSFYKTLSFGTGGLRGIMGVGSNRMNAYNVRAATQGLANYINKTPGKHSVLIGFDSRNHSKEFAEETAKVFAANGIKVFLYKELRPVPLVSFGCRYKKCSAAVMVTASHNPPQYNGYKVYWSNGAQVLPPHDVGIINEVNLITDPKMVKISSLDNPLIEYITDEMDKAYLDAVRSLQIYPDMNKKDGKNLKVVYTSLHGAGITLVPKILNDWGFTNITLVPKQTIPDGNFPTCASPNPEERETLKLGIQTLMETSGDILIATDPDTDRIGVVVRHEGKEVILNGNEFACVAAYSLFESMKEKGTLPEKAALIKTIVTTELLVAIANGYGKKCFDVLTGFKYIGEMIDKWQQDKNGYEFIFGGEESYGYLWGTSVRDKDAVIASALACEIALRAKNKKQTLVDVLYEIYHRFGIHREKLLSLTYTGKEGSEKMQAVMQTLRQNHPQSFANIAVVAVDDYISSTKTFYPTLKTEAIPLPKSDVLMFWLADKTKLVIRPSGTEPKIKIYCASSLKDFETLEKGIEDCDAYVDKILASMKENLG
ncbi:MAG: phospho-sugar mutase [Parachlamydiales bacterium]|nr:phospho-sugar mutase [Parachlamydiales bacterium]